MEPTGHCPFVGLKQNRAIRFSSPTPEHRCYVSGEPGDIPVEQATFCLSRNHTQCPLYMGLTVPTMPPDSNGLVTTDPTPETGFAAWFRDLSQRDRLVYALMLGLLALIIGVYIVAGLQSLGTLPSVAVIPTTTTASDRTAEPTRPAATPPGSTAEVRSPTAIPATPTALPTSTPSPRPTEQPTRAPIILVPTGLATQVPAGNPTATAAPATALVPASPTSMPTATRPVASQVIPSATRVTPSVVPPTVTIPPATARPQPTRVPAPPATVQPQPTRVPAPPATARPKPTSLPPTPVVIPTDLPAPTQPPAPQPAPVISNQYVWLYFSDTSDTLYVPIQRRVAVEDKQVARAAVLALIEGPRTNLVPAFQADTQLLGIRIENGTAIVNFDRDPSGGDGRGHDALVLTLTHFSTIKRVQIQVNGHNLGGVRARPVVNPVNPLSLPTDPKQTEFLPLYFLSNDGYHHVRVIRMVPKTRQTAEGTVRALLEGPGGFGYALQQVIPAGTELRAIWIEDGVVVVDFTKPFADAPNRWAATRTITESLTTLPGVRGVRFLIEGSSAGDYWGGEFAGVFERPLINAE